MRPCRHDKTLLALTVGEKCRPLWLLFPHEADLGAAILTAWNPFNRPTSRRANAVAQKQFVQEFEWLGLPHTWSERLGVDRGALVSRHEAVTVAGRYAFLPFLYDEAAARIRAANTQFLDPSVGTYKGG